MTKDTEELPNDIESAVRIPKYRKKPIVIEAVQLRWATWSEMCEFLGDIISEDNPGRYTSKWPTDACGEEAPYIELTIPTLEGEQTALHGDYIIRSTYGDFWISPPGAFLETYEPAEQPPDGA